jgi:hypothetical protein
MVAEAGAVTGLARHAQPQRRIANIIARCRRACVPRSVNRVWPAKSSSNSASPCGDLQNQQEKQLGPVYTKAFTD